MTQVTPARPRSFSTVGLPEEQRIELWESHNAEALIGLRCRTLTESLLDATEVNLPLERVHMARVRGSAHVVERDVALVRQRPTQSVALFFGLEGEAFFYHDDGVRTLQPGQLLVCEADRPFLRGFSHGLEELVLKVPQELFVEATGIGSLPRPVVVPFADGEHPHAEALARLVGSAVREESPQPVRESEVLALLGALTSPGRTDGPASHAAAVRAYVERHLRDGSLSAARVAAAVGLSPRHLSRVCAELGATFPQYLLGRRLELARSVLEGPDAGALTVAEVAHRCGFASASHFSQAFRDRYGEPPAQVRRRAAVHRSLA